MGVGGDGAGEGGGGAYADDTKGERSRSHVLVDCWYFVMVAGDDGAGEGGRERACSQEHTASTRTTIPGFRALVSSRLDVRVTTRRVTSHRTQCSRFACCHSTLVTHPLGSACFQLPNNVVVK